MTRFFSAAPFRLAVLWGAGLTAGGACVSREWGQLAASLLVGSLLGTIILLDDERGAR